MGSVAPPVQARSEKHSEEKQAELSEGRRCELVMNYKHLAGHGDRRELQDSWTEIGQDVSRGEGQVERRSPWETGSL